MTIAQKSTKLLEKLIELISGISGLEPELTKADWQEKLRI